MDKSESERRFENYRMFLLNEAQRLTNYIDVYRTLQERTDDNLEQINIAPAFFSTVIDALFSAIILWTDKMFDQEGQRGLFNFLVLCEHNRKIFAVKELQRRRNYPNDHRMLHNRSDVSYKMIQDHHQKIEQLSWFPSIKTRRDKFHGHFDTNYFFNREKIVADAPLKYSDLQEIIEAMDDVINTYSATYDGQVFSMESMNIRDVNGILRRLQQSANDPDFPIPNA